MASPLSAAWEEAERALAAAIGTADPTSALLEYYQSLGKGAKGKGADKGEGERCSAAPTYRDAQHRDEGGIATGWWRAALRCPATDREYESGLPRSVWLSSSTSGAGAGADAGGSDDSVGWGTILAKLGESKVLDGGGRVYFKSKKGARKAAAIAAYEGNLLASRRGDGAGCGGDADGQAAVIPQVVFSSKADAMGAASPTAADATVPGTDQASGGRDREAVSTDRTASIRRHRAGRRRPRSRYPVWVERLSRVGVTASTISIRFREHPSSRSQRRDAQHLSREYPTELCAVVDISGPFRFSMTSLPTSSRARALDGMSLLVEEESRRQNVRPVADVDWEVKEGLLRSAPDQTATFLFTPPPCFTAPIDEDGSQQLFVYEMIFTNESGEDFVPSAMCLPPKVCSRMALVLGQDFFEGNEVGRGLDTTIELPTRNGIDKVKLSLCNRTVVSPKGSRDLPTIHQFNLIVSDWKRYGIVKLLRSDGTVTLKDPLSLDQYGDRKDGRSCMFVPLEKQDDDNRGGVKIDFDLMHRVVDYNIQPYFLSTALNNILSHHNALIFGLASVAFTDFQWSGLEAGAAPFDTLDWVKIFLADRTRTVLLRVVLLTLVHYFAISLYPPKRSIADETILNRFLTQSAGVSGLFVVNRRNCLPGAGSKGDALTAFDISSDDGPIKTSCYEIYSKRYSTRIRYKNQPLLSSSFVKQHAKEDLLRRQDTNPANIIHLPPELVHVLPCPRDILYLCGQYFETMLVSLERTITLMNVEQRLQELEAKHCLPINEVPASCLYDNLDEGCDSLALLDKATGLFPTPTYQRLEFLGDAILNYALAVNLFTKNSNLSFDADQLGDAISAEMNNKQLGQAALRVGIPKILGVGGSKARECSQKTLSDVVEALVAIAFIRDPGGSGVVGLFNEMGLSFSLLSGENATKGFVASSPCFIGSYPFGLHQNWNEQIVAVAIALAVDRHIDEKLEGGFASLCNILDNQNSGFSKLLSQRTKILLRCALFDASPTSDNDGDSSLTSASPLKGLNLVGICRDNLFFIGNYALNLCLSTELYKRFPDAPPKDLTLLTFCTFTDETMAYILTKNDLTKCLFDKDAPTVAEFLLAMKLADERGTEIWKQNDGWLFGIDEYRRRMKNGFHFNASDDDLHPQYPGLGGGLLVGYVKKLDKDLTEDLAFSMKAICGALVLSLGVDGMWKVMGSLFSEAMLLSPKENQSLYEENSVCKGWK